MFIIHTRRATFGCACLFASILCFAQTDSLLKTTQDASATAVADAAVGNTAARNIAAHNTATDSLERAVERAIVADFSPLTVAAEDQPTYLSELRFFPGASLFDDILLAQANPQNQPKPPTAPTLGDLGFPTEQTKGSAEEQARLDKRSHMLKIHQRLGWRQRD